VLVYGGFTVQAVGLGGGFVLYARRRWPELFRLRTGELSLGPAHRRHAALARAASLAALAYLGLHLSWALGADLGRTGQDEDPAGAKRTFSAVLAAFAMLGMIAVLLLGDRSQAQPAQPDVTEAEESAWPAGP
jgi:hypothetical protein